MVCCNTTLRHTGTTASAGLSAGFKPLYDQAMAVATSISQARALLLVVGTEWDVYSAGGRGGVPVLRASCCNAHWYDCSAAANVGHGIRPLHPSLTSCVRSPHLP